MTRAVARAGPMAGRLSGSDGRRISETQAQTASYAGADVRRMALTLVNEKADEVVATLYADYCRNAVPPARGKTAAQQHHLTLGAACVQRPREQDHLHAASPSADMP